MAANPVLLAELVAVRMTHDLSGLLGSLGGVLELARETPADASEEAALAAETAGELMQRLQLFRAAWGSVAEPMDLPTLHARKTGALGGHRLQLNLDALAEATVFPPAMAKLVLNVLLLAVESLPRGGVLTLSGDPADRVVAQIAGPGAAWPAGFVACLIDEAQAWAALDSPRLLQAPLTALIARALGMRLSVMMGPEPATRGAPPPLLLSGAQEAD